MRLSRMDYNPALSQDDVDALVNSLIVSFDDFAMISGLRGRAYGVLTAIDPNKNTLNQCARQKVFTHLIKTQAEAEKLLAYAVTERYCYQTIPYNPARRIQLKLPGFAGFYRQTITDAVMGAQDVDPYLIQDVPLVDSTNGYTIAKLDITLVDNPAKVVLVNADTGHQYHYDETKYGFPRISAGYWELPLQGDLIPADIGSKIVNAFHAELIKVDIPAETLTAGQLLYPVYPGTDQIIPYAKEPEDLGAGAQRLWFYAYALVNPSFAYEEVDLRGGALQFYKLLQTIEMRIFEDTEVLPQLLYRQEPYCSSSTDSTSDDSPTFTAIEIESYKTIDQKASIIELYPDSSAAEEADAGTAMEWQIYYKVDPQNVGFSNDYYDIKEAICYKTAAELPIKICGCPLDNDGFIMKAQEMFTQVRLSLTGERVENTEYGKMVGQEVFRDKLSNVNAFNRVVEL